MVAQIDSFGYYQMMGWSILIIIATLFLAVGIIWYFNRKHKWSMRKKGIYIGLYIGFIWGIAGGIRSISCGFAPVDSLANTGLCTNQLLWQTYTIPLLLTFPPIVFPFIGILIGLGMDSIGKLLGYKNPYL